MPKRTNELVHKKQPAKQTKCLSYEEELSKLTCGQLVQKAGEFIAVHWKFPTRPVRHGLRFEHMRLTHKKFADLSWPKGKEDTNLFFDNGSLTLRMHDSWVVPIGSVFRFVCEQTHTVPLAFCGPSDIEATKQNLGRAVFRFQELYYETTGFFIVEMASPSLLYFEPIFTDKIECKEICNIPLA